MVRTECYWTNMISPLPFPWDLQLTDSWVASSHAVPDKEVTPEPESDALRVKASPAPELSKPKKRPGSSS